MRERDMTNEAQELYDRREDTDEWEDTPEQIEVRPPRTAVLSVRLPIDEFNALEAVATSAGLSLSKFVREAIMQKLRGTLIPTGTINKSIGYVESGAQTDDFKVWNQNAKVPEITIHDLQPTAR